MAAFPGSVLLALWPSHLMDAPSPTAPPTGDSAILRAIGSQIRDQMALPWVPPLLRTPKLQHLQVGPPNSHRCWPCPPWPHLGAQASAPPSHQRPPAQFLLDTLILLSPQGSASQKPFHTTRLLMPESSSRGGKPEAVGRG